MEEEVGMSMTAKEVARMFDWFQANGHTTEEAAECLKYIVNAQAPAKTETKEK